MAKKGGLPSLKSLIGVKKPKKSAKKPKTGMDAFKKKGY